MKKGTGLLLIISTFVLILLIIVVKSYRGLSILKEEVNNKEVDINVQLTRKKEQVTKLIEISKKYIKNEDTLLTELELLNNSFENVDTYIVREKATINEKTIELLNKLFDKYDENMYKDEELKTTINDIISTEKRIDIASENYNKAADEYNKKINSFPSSIISFFRGFKRADRFTISVELKNILEIK